MEHVYELQHTFRVNINKGHLAEIGSPFLGPSHTNEQRRQSLLRVVIGMETCVRHAEDRSVPERRGKDSLADFKLLKRLIKEFDPETTQHLRRVTDGASPVSVHLTNGHTGRSSKN